MFEFIESPNQSSRAGNQVAGVIIHSTSGGPAQDSIKYLCNQVPAPADATENVVMTNGVKCYDAKASAHYVIERDGTGAMLVPENMAAWHAGSRTSKPTLSGRGDLNLWTIGIELCNWGPLYKSGDRFYTWPNHWSNHYAGPAPIVTQQTFEFVRTDSSYTTPDGKPAFPNGTISYWENYQEPQIITLIQLLKEKVRQYSIKRECIAGHSAVDPTRKVDPGPQLPWDRIFSEIYATPKVIFDLSATSPHVTHLPVNADMSKGTIGFLSKILGKLLFS
jgi:N-acetyl-anhydromuramyl-L-alanine amidase AmpD